MDVTARLSAWLNSYRRDLRAALELAARDGFRRISANAPEVQLNPDQFSQSARRHLKRHLADLGLTLDALGAESGGLGLADPREGDRRIVQLKQTLTLCRDLGVSLASVDVGGLADQASAALARQALERCAALADASGVQIVVRGGDEPPALLRDQLRQIGYPGLLVGLDTATFEPAPGAGLQWVGLVGGVALRDVRRSPTSIEETDYGAGQVEFVRFAAALEEAGYAGPLTLRRDGPCGVDALRRGRDYVQSLLQGAARR